MDKCPKCYDHGAGMNRGFLYAKQRTGGVDACPRCAKVAEKQFNKLTGEENDK